MAIALGAAAVMAPLAGPVRPVLRRAGLCLADRSQLFLRLAGGRGEPVFRVAGMAPRGPPWRSQVRTTEFVLGCALLAIGLAIHFVASFVGMLLLDVLCAGGDLAGGAVGARRQGRGRGPTASPACSRSSWRRCPSLGINRWPTSCSTWPRPFPPGPSTAWACRSSPKATCSACRAIARDGRGVQRAPPAHGVPGPGRCGRTSQRPGILVQGRPGGPVGCCRPGGQLRPRGPDRARPGAGRSPAGRKARSTRSKASSWWQWDC